ncbi:MULTISPECIES: NAD(P)-dependent oxidoreductase [Bhargavaea]|uniref:NAD(P)-dependent oxidoreductase n=1 Tax=Bhargavaea changchunensis TaxID=2134037 RepID=A0ABW2NFJ4_9BACL|nr:SDR family oxidoreductase [Bhargavaea sp. CC-171006]
MNILILGGTGRVGSHIVAQALEDEHHVTVLVRTPEKVTINHNNLTVIQGDVLNQEALTHAIHGADVLISALNTDGGTTLSESMPLIINAMETEGIRRIITIGTAGILQSRVNPEILRYQSSESKRKTTRAAEEHEKVYNLLKQYDLDWTIVCPTYLPDGERLGNYRTEPDFLPEGGSQISVPDTAEFAYSLIESGEHIKKRVGIAY